jgi:hypothetical protein
MGSRLGRLDPAASHEQLIADRTRRALARYPAKIAVAKVQAVSASERKKMKKDAAQALRGLLGEATLVGKRKKGRVWREGGGVRPTTRGTPRLARRRLARRGSTSLTRPSAAR